MKPQPHLSTEELLQGVSKATRPLLPYDTYQKEKASFITFAIAEEFVSLPLALLAKATLRATYTALSLEFGPIVVEVTGSHLDGLYEAILTAQIRVIRKGKHPTCSVDSVRISEITLA